VSRLNPQQQQAIKEVERPLLVLAGAGSGKTTVITQKIAFLVNERALRPSHIYAVTFTNKAAREMKERAAKQLPKDAAKALHISTFHNLGLNIIRKEHQLLGIKPNFSIFDAHDSLTLIKELIANPEAIEKETINFIGKMPW